MGGALDYDVAFDYDGALALARQLWSLADQVVATAATRHDHATYAQHDFTGTYATDFSNRMKSESELNGRVAQGLREHAKAMASMWKTSMDNQNQRIYARHLDWMHENRGGWAQVGDFFSGFEAPPEPQEVPVPQPPEFKPTVTDFVRYRS